MDGLGAGDELADLDQEDDQDHQDQKDHEETQVQPDPWDPPLPVATPRDPTQKQLESAE